MNPELPYIIVASLLTIGAATWLLTPIVRGLGERLRGGPGAADLDALRLEMEALRDTLQQARGDVADLQERVDFAERLLAQQRDAARLPGK
ncbi:MAG TPA: hypothetical protein VD707_08530 [Gemmatimonadales bacterium]|nr:hypothetical protein [Gemmatimonadales bacterium]